MMSRDGYIPQSTTALAVNELFGILAGRIDLEQGLVEALLASRVGVLKAIDQNPELRHRIERLVFMMAGYFTDQDYDI